LIEVNRDVCGGDAPREVSAKEPLNIPHEVDGDKFREDLTELAFNSITFREVDKVIHIETKAERDKSWRITLVRRIRDETGKEARIMRVGNESHRLKNGIDLVIPMLRAAPEAI
jgi:DNA-binding transcriptional regulator/RsmH inhibitor MraZ